jgi:hypothetical protein
MFFLSRTIKYFEILSIFDFVYMIILWLKLDNLVVKRKSYLIVNINVLFIGY